MGYNANYGIQLDFGRTGISEHVASRLSVYILTLAKTVTEIPLYESGHRYQINSIKYYCSRKCSLIQNWQEDTSFSHKLYAVGFGVNTESAGGS